MTHISSLWQQKTSEEKPTKLNPINENMYSRNKLVMHGNALILEY